MGINNWDFSIIVFCDYKSCRTGAAHPGEYNYIETQVNIKLNCKWGLTEHTADPQKRVMQTSETQRHFCCSARQPGYCTCLWWHVLSNRKKTNKKTSEPGSAWAVYHSNKTLPVKHLGLKSRTAHRPTVSVNPRSEYWSTPHRTESFRGEGRLKKNCWRKMNYVSKDKGINKRLMCSVFGQENSGGARWQPEI